MDTDYHSLINDDAVFFYRSVGATAVPCVSRDRQYRDGHAPVKSQSNTIHCVHDGDHVPLHTLCMHQQSDSFTVHEGSSCTLFEHFLQLQIPGPCTNDKRS